MKVMWKLQVFRAEGAERIQSAYRPVKVTSLNLLIFCKAIGDRSFQSRLTIHEFCRTPKYSCIEFQAHTIRGVTTKTNRRDLDARFIRKRGIYMSISANYMVSICNSSCYASIKPNPQEGLIFGN